MTTDPTPRPTEYWTRVELLRRLEQITRETSMTEVSAKTGAAKATLYRWFWGERSPSFDALRALYTAYPAIFPELSILKEESDDHPTAS